MNSQSRTLKLHLPFILTGVDFAGILKGERLAGAVLFVCAVVIYYLNVDFRVSGDSLVYANIVLNRRFDVLPLHFGYYVIVFGISRAVALFAEIPLDELLVYINVFFGAAGILVAFCLAKHFLKSTNYAILCSIILLFSGRYFVNATSAEIYISQTFFLLLSFYLFVVRRPVCAGLSYLIALLISPLSIFFFLFFPVTALIKRMEKKKLAFFILSWAALYLLFLSFTYRELFWGTRGLLNFSASNHIQPLEGAESFIKYNIKYFSFLIPVAFIGVLYSLKERHLLYIYLATFLPNIYVLTKIVQEDNVHILAMDFFTATFIALGFLNLKQFRFKRFAVPALSFSFVLFSFFLNSTMGGDHNLSYKDDLKTIHGRYIKNQNSIIITSWWDGIAYRYYNREQMNIKLYVGEASEKCFNAEKLNPAKRDYLMEYDNIYVLESYVPSRISKLLLPARMLQQRYNEYSLKRRAEEILGLEMEEIPCGSLELYGKTNIKESSMPVALVESGIIDGK